ncbi:hypothetical protein MPH_03842 [Macrophomina phaseolina MS6]|uniref:Uncharacterized protein n=1 Tax=Macrophomina phaseolina (strain MS6) TaxID=1126212 RepID=K2R8R8_MACPH|nr:hypothetical protein MPH_03842 [Macrophomina phaseolina MS6]
MSPRNPRSRPDTTRPPAVSPSSPAVASSVPLHHDFAHSTFPPIFFHAMPDLASHQDSATVDGRTQSERAMEHLEWLGGRLHPLEQSVLLNNLEKFMKDSDSMVARIKRGERPADVFASSDAGNTSTRSGPPPTESAGLDAGTSRRRRLSSGQSKALNGSASASSPSLETARRGLSSSEQGLAPANPRKRHAEQGEHVDKGPINPSPLTFPSHSLLHWRPAPSVDPKLDHLGDADLP